MISAPTKANRKLPTFGAFLIIFLCAFFPFFIFCIGERRERTTKSKGFHWPHLKWKISQYWFVMICVLLVLLSVSTLSAFLIFFFQNENISRNSPFQFAFGFSQERFLFSCSLIMTGSRQYLYFPASQTYALVPTPYQVSFKDHLTDCILALHECFHVMLWWEHMIIQEKTCSLKSWQEDEAVTETPCLACCRQQEQRRAQAPHLMAVWVLSLD